LLHESGGAGLASRYDQFTHILPRPPTLAKNLNHTYILTPPLFIGLTQELKHRYAAPLVKTTIIHPMFAKTGIIKGFEEPLKKAKVPLIPAEVVGDAIIKQVLSGSSGQIYVPPPMGYVSGIRGWPHWMQENMRDGVAKVMGEVVRR
jgi:hypothetical protein